MTSLVFEKTVTATLTVGLSTITENVAGNPFFVSVVPAALTSLPPSVIPAVFPTSLPLVIQPPNGIPDQPENTALVQVGFLDPLNYLFVVSHQLVVAQIFYYLPVAIAYGVDVNISQIAMHSIRPYNTSAGGEHVTTMAYAYIPSLMVSQFSFQVHTPNTKLYDNPDATAHFLISYVNPAFPVAAGAAVSSTSTLSTPDTSPTGISSGVKIGIGIAVPIVTIALVVLGTLFWRRKRNRHVITKEATENQDDRTPQEMAADAKSHEMQAEENRHELRTEERDQELQGDARRRQELGGTECAQELEAGPYRPERG